MQVGIDILVSAVLTESPLHVIVGCGFHLRVVEVDKVRVPVGVFFLGQQRCIRRHDHHVGISLHVGHIGRLDESVGHVVALRSPFAQIDFRALTVVVVVEVAVVEVPADGVVVVFIYYLDALLLGFFPSILVIAAFPEGANGSDDCDFRMSLLHTFDEKTVTLQEHIADEVFVANA